MLLAREQSPSDAATRITRVEASSGMPLPSTRVETSRGMLLTSTHVEAALTTNVLPSAQALFSPDELTAPIMVELQIWFSDIAAYNETSHYFYELERAASPDKV